VRDRLLFRAAEPVALVGGGPVDAAALEAVLALAPEAVAADGGGDVALPGGRRFGAVIGDMDSLSGADRLRAEGVPVHHLPEQETTDLEKCLYSVAAPLLLGVGFLGGRADHHLAAMNALVKYAHRAVVLVGAEDVCFLCPPVLALDLPARTRVSLFPMAPARGVVSEGLRWSVEGLALSPGGRTGISNEALGGRLRVGFDARVVLAILPIGLLPDVAGLLASEPGADHPP
jgi:thiamine pyrophosphokinase